VLRLAADENFNGDIVRGLIRRCPDVDIVRAQDVGLQGAEDPILLAWCGDDRRVLLTHDVRTMIGFAYQRVASREAMPGIIVVGQTLPIRQAIEDLVLLVECSDEGEWEGQVIYLPLR
jgi:hypothetical protein